MSDDPREQIHTAEARLTALPSRRQRWLNRFAAAEGVQGAAVERANCKSNLRLVDEAIIVAEARLKAALIRRAHRSGSRIIAARRRRRPRGRRSDLVKPPQSSSGFLWSNGCNSTVVSRTSERRKF
jgi:hypothetical protein